MSLLSRSVEECVNKPLAWLYWPHRGTGGGHHDLLSFANENCHMTAHVMSVAVKILHEDNLIATDRLNKCH